LVTAAQVATTCFSFSPSWLGLVVCGSECVCFVQGVFVWWCQLRLVMYYCFFFLNDRAVLLLLFFKKNLSIFLLCITFFLPPPRSFSAWKSHWASFSLDQKETHWASFYAFTQTEPVKFSGSTW
jgi:hypothetical protein